jgi:hypothetical protein
MQLLHVALAREHLLNSWRAWVANRLHPYRPEMHYMRGPGPKCREKSARTYTLPAGLLPADQPHRFVSLDRVG